jgi:hypothetical protein
MKQELSGTSRIRRLEGMRGWARRRVVGIAVGLFGLGGLTGLSGCGSDKMTLTADAPINVEAPPSVGAHALVFQRQSAPQGKATISTPALTTAATGSTILVSQGRGILTAFELPTDNKGNAPYVQLGQAHPYDRYRDSGTALYAFAKVKGGSGHVISANTPPSDEITLSAVEVKGTVIQDFQWKEVLMGSPLTSPKVTTTGPATLVAWWWGDAGVDSNKTAVPNNGFQVIDSVLVSGALVQSAVAVKEVTAAGSYDVTWTSTPVQGAQLWIVAVQP